MTAAWCDIDSNQDTYVAKAIIMCLDVCESISAFNVVFHGDIDGEMDTKKS